MLAPSHYYQQTCGRPDLLETSHRRNKITTSLPLSPLWERSIFKDDANFAGTILKVHPGAKYTQLYKLSWLLLLQVLLLFSVFWVITPCDLVCGYWSEKRIASFFYVKSPWKKATFSRNEYNYYKIKQCHNQESHNQHRENVESLILILIQSLS
jgi:hypothetical protein